MLLVCVEQNDSLSKLVFKYWLDKLMCLLLENLIPLVIKTGPCYAVTRYGQLLTILVQEVGTETQGKCDTMFNEVNNNT